MSHWDFSRPADGQHDAPRPSAPASAAYPPDRPGDSDGAWPARDEWPEQDEWQAHGQLAPLDGWPADDGRAAQAGLVTRDGWAGDERSASDGGWAPDGDWSAAANGWTDGAWPANNGWDAGGDPGADDDPDAGGNPDADGDGDDGDWEDGTAPYPLTYERDDFAVADVPEPTSPERGWDGQDRGADRQDPDLAGGDSPADWDWADRGRTRRGRRRLLIPAGVAVAGAAVGAAAVMLAGGHPATQGSRSASGGATPPAAPSAARGTPASTAPAAPSAPPVVPLTVTEAKNVLARYTDVNNRANAQRDGTLLASVESGSSYAIDAGLYTQQRAAGTVPYPAFGPVQATYFIPRDQPASGPRWFVVQVANAFTSNQQKVTSNEYLLFTQQAPGGAWQETAEPYLLPGASGPRVALGADGLATAVSPDAGTVAVAPGQLPAATAAALDGNGTSAGAGTGTGNGTGTGTSAGVVADPGNLADRGDQKFWQGSIAGGTVTDAHTAAAGTDGQEFALLTADGGALVFYTDAAQVTITPPAGSALRLTVPSLYSPSQSLPRAGVRYLEQFAAYDPPPGAGAPRVVADYSGITGKD
jgi:hypothetical protein